MNDLIETMRYKRKWLYSYWIHMVLGAIILFSFFIIMNVKVIPFWTVGLAFLVIISVTILQSIMQIIETYKIRTLKNIRAKLVYEKSRRNQNVRFNLFLRPFKLDILPYYKSEFMKKITGLPEYSENFNNALADSLEFEVPLIALGGREDVNEIGNLNTQNDWQNIIFILTQKAERIFIIPWNSPGLIWEIEYILHTDLLNKCFFVQPPEKFIGKQKRSWMSGMKSLEALGLKIPIHHKQGAIFKYASINNVTIVKLPRFRSRYTERQKRKISRLVSKMH